MEPSCKTCTKCGVSQSVGQFAHRRGAKDGLASWCRTCSKKNSRDHYLRNREKYLGRHREWHRANDGGHWAQTKTLYSVTKEQYQLLLRTQNGVCAICRCVPGKRHLHIDHCHESGKIRGLLCGNCNRGIGYLRDDVGILRLALVYLENA